MRRRIQEVPWAFALMWFLITQVGVTVAGILLGALVARQPCHPRGPGDPCDGPAMLAVAIWSLSIPAGFVFGIFAAALAYWYAAFAGRQRKTLPSILDSH
jgi:hypothetical protein